MKSFMVSWADNVLLGALSAMRGVRLTGSFARGTPSQTSDLDFKVSRDALNRVKQLIEQRGERWESDFIGHVKWGGMEFYQNFDAIPRRDRVALVKINGWEFRTA
jgi:hypothetical protein